MPDQKEHLEILARQFAALVQALPTDKTPEQREALELMSESLRGLDIRFVNDDEVYRILEGSNKAIGALANRHTALTNRSARPTPLGVNVTNTEALEFVQAFLSVSPNPDLTYQTPSFLPCLRVVTEMLMYVKSGDKAVIGFLLTEAFDRLAKQKTPS